MEKAWELAVVSWDLAISILLSTGVFAVFAVGLIVASILGSIWIWDNIKDDVFIAIKNYPEDEREGILKEFHNASHENRRISRFEDETFIDGGLVELDVDKKVEGGEQKGYFKTGENTPLRKMFNQKYPNFGKYMKDAKEKLAPARLLAKIVNIIYVPTILLAGVCLFFFTTNFFGIGVEFESREDTERRAEVVEEQQNSLIFEIKSDIDLLLDPEELKVGVAQRLTKELPVKLAKLKVNLEKQTAENQLVREEFAKTISRIEKEQNELFQLQSLTKKQLTAVRSSITQEAEKSSRQYYLLGLLLSIPLFWLSDTIKYLGLRGFRRGAVFWHRRRLRKGKVKASNKEYMDIM